MGDFIDIKTIDEKKGERHRSEASLRGFNDFVSKMEMEEIQFLGRKWTWANNWEGEGHIEGRLDMFFGAANWLINYENAIVKHVKR